MITRSEFNGRLPLPHTQASSLFIGSDSSARDTNQMALWNPLARGQSDLAGEVRFPCT